MTRCQPAPRRRAFTMVELIIVVGVIILLVGIALPALSGVLGMGRQTSSMSHMRQIGTWMSLYSTDNEDLVLPSEFDYRYPDCPDCYRGKVRNVVGDPATQEPHTGTWADILWTTNDLGVFPGAEGAVSTDLDAYRFDSPDGAFYDRFDEALGGQANVLRSTVANSRDAINVGTPGATPFGEGARESGDPGYFAANQFFNAAVEVPDPRSKNGFWSNGQIRSASRSLYLVDSFYGETISLAPEAWDTTQVPNSPDDLVQVDFRYGETCAILYLDGHVSPQTEWGTLDDLETGIGRQIRVRNLTER